MNEHKMFKHMCSFVLFMLANCCHSIEQRHYGKYEYGTCPSEESKFREFIKISIRDCVKNCALRPYCKIAGYKRRFKTCSLHYRTSEDLASYGNPECVQIKMYTVDVAQLSGGCDCGDWLTCGTDTGVCIIKDLTNIALQKPTEQLSTYSTAVSSRGVDGNTNQDYYLEESCFHTMKENNPWWRVDLEVLSFIKYARLYNRLDGANFRRTRDVSIEVGKTLDAMKEVATIPGTVADIEEVQMPVGTFVRYFKITLKAKEFLHFCEVEIFGYMCD